MTSWNTTKLPTSNFYGLKTGYVDNAIKTEFDSGRTVAVKKNTANKRRYSLSYAADSEQEKYFFDWYEKELGGNAGTFTAPSLRGDGTMQEYRLDGTPTSSGMGIKEINMVWVEV